MQNSSQPLLVVEDDPNDLFFLERALRKARLNLTVRSVTNGEQAIKYLSGQAPFADRQAYPIPYSILLDLKMPFVNGFQVLEWVRSQPALSKIQIFVLTGSSVERDRDRALELGARGYLVKPPTPELLLEVLSAKQVSP